MNSRELLAIPMENLFQIKGLSKFFRFKPNVYLKTETNDYVLKTATSYKEMWEAFKLRHQCFTAGLDRLPFIIPIDLDEYDYRCDHLLIKCKKTKKIVGTYRLRSSLFVDNFYSDNEFFLKSFHREKGNKLELGRACIHPNYRNGATINLLWKGISEYMRMTKSQYLFGCSSIYSTDPIDISALFSYLKQNNMYENPYNVDTQINFHMEVTPDLCLMDKGEQVAKEILPPLVRSYLMAGAKIHGYPAHDRPFKCVDLLTILDLGNVSKPYKRRYFSWYQ